MFVESILMSIPCERSAGGALRKAVVAMPATRRRNTRMPKTGRTAIHAGMANETSPCSAMPRCALGFPWPMLRPLRAIGLSRVR